DATTSTKPSSASPPASSPTATSNAFVSASYSIDREETVTGIAGFGFALRYDAPAVDAISCSVPVARLTAERQERVVAVMRDVQTKIEALLSPRSGAPDWR
ncbi:IclR family transcriptional regulator C-terminal domain-containing protein, partial [Streptomyces sp. A475]|uniref:IclR family transcriptional regulator domain-containing protein n=1 Tax=Streptomyces sp. A475 TaxID=3131976 RepID=UPI0030C92876